MPTTPTYPGVYIEEIPSGVRTLVGVATSVAAFVDRFDRGPLNAPVRTFSQGDFDREFGGLTAESEASYGVRQFFLNGGTEAWVVRVAGAGADTARVNLPETIPLGSQDVLQVRAGRQIGRDSVDDPGPWGNALRVEVDYNTRDPLALFNLTVSEVRDDAGQMTVLRSETHRNLTLEPGTPDDAIAKVNAASKLVQLVFIGAAAAPDPFDPAFRPDCTGTLGALLPAAPGGGQPVVPDNAQIAITVNPGGGQPALPAVNATISYAGAVPETYLAFRPFLEAAIRAALPTNPLLAGASVRLTGNRFHVLLGRGRGFQADATATFADAGADTAATTLGLAGASVRPQMFALINGAAGNAPTDANLRGTRAAKTGIYALEDADLFNILCIPAAAELAQAASFNVYAEAEAYCAERRAFLIVDISTTQDDLNAMETWLTENNGLRHPNAAVYFPRVQIADPLNQNRLRSLAPSGTIAGLYAATDGSRGVWKAPAGTDARLRNVQGLDYLLTDRENGVINPLGVNALRNFPVYGNVSWGARTLDGADVQASDWKYVPVRRLALFLEESLYRGTKWAVFEPNDEPLWAQIRLSIGAFMQNLFRQGAFQGRTPREAYLVKCDAETTTQDDINRGIVNILVGFAPLKPAEFVIIRIQQLAGQVEA